MSKVKQARFIIHFVKYTLNGIYFEYFFTQYYDKNIGLKDIIKAYHINN